MNITKTRIMAFMASASLVATLGLAACGGSSSSSEAASSSSTTETTTETTDSSSSATTDSSGSAVSDSASKYANAWMGVSTAEETYYYAETEDGSEGLLVIYDPETNKYVSYVGKTSTNDEGWITITDETTSNTFTFEITEADKDGNVILDAGEQGTVTLAKCEVQEVLDVMQKINDNAQAVA